MVKARAVSHTIIQGIHGRKKAGPGETFWQFRKYQTGDAVSQIDWRKSASSPNYYIREKEWEAAHTIWLWPDLSPSMTFGSKLSRYTKREKALLMMFAVSYLLTNAGERVGLMGLTTPGFSRKTTERMAEVILSKLSSGFNWKPLPEDMRLSPFSECVILTDCLEPIKNILDKCRNFASQGIRGHVIQILDPIEETFPFSGHTEFHDHTLQQKYTISKAEDIRASYQKKLYDLKSELKTQLGNLNWTYLVHHTDQKETEALLGLYKIISETPGAIRQNHNVSQSEKLVKTNILTEGVDR